MIPRESPVPLDARGTDSNEPSQPESTAELASILGANLRRIRVGRNLSLESLSRASGVSRAMLSQVELGRSAPTIGVLWKIARALALPFSALLSDGLDARSVVLRARTAKILRSQDGTFTSRALFPVDAPRTVEFYEVRLLPGSVERADPHAAGTTENLVVAKGALTLVVHDERHRLDAGDAIFFAADSPHEYRNEGDEEATAYLVMTYQHTEPRFSAR